MANFIVKQASALTSQQLSDLGLTGIPSDWPVESYPYTGSVPAGFTEMTDTQIAAIIAADQAAYNTWVSPKLVPGIRLSDMHTITGAFNGVAQVGKFLEFSPGIYSVPLIKDVNIGAMSITAAVNSTVTCTLYKNSDFVTVISTISLASQTLNTVQTNFNLFANDIIFIQVTSGSATKPAVFLFLQ